MAFKRAESMFFKHIPHIISTFLRKFATKTTLKTMMIGRYEEVKILQSATCRVQPFISALCK